MESSTDCPNKELPLIVVLGASGFVGQNLVKALLAGGRYKVRAVVRDLNSLKRKHAHLEVVLGDVTSKSSLEVALCEAQVVFYLVHSLTSTSKDLYEQEAQMAKSVGLVAETLGIKRLVYLGGLGSDKQRLSRHLASRHNTGDILRQHLPLVIEFRASVIVGSGSISFEIIRWVISKLPLIVLPQSARTLTQPIGIPDVLLYLVSSIDIPLTESKIVEIGGPEQFSYQSFLVYYANYLGKKRLIFSTPCLPQVLAGYLLYLLLPDNLGKVGQNMVESFQNEMVVTNDLATELFPAIIPKPVKEYFTA